MSGKPSEWPRLPAAAMPFPVYLGDAALCVDARAGLDASAWDAESPRELRALAVRTCSLCPVVDECAEWAATVPRTYLSGVIAGRYYMYRGYTTPGGDRDAEGPWHD